MSASLCKLALPAFVRVQAACDVHAHVYAVDSLAEQQRRRQELRLRVRPMRKDLQAAIRKERARGVQWLFAVTLFTVWVSGIFDNATPLRP